MNKILIHATSRKLENMLSEKSHTQKIDLPFMDLKSHGRKLYTCQSCWKISTSAWPRPSTRIPMRRRKAVHWRVP